MWNKKEDSPQRESTSPAPTPAASSPPRQSAPRQASSSAAVIGPSITIKGDLSGEEDLVIEGRVEGEVRLKQHSVTIGRSGRVHADVFGKSIKVEGEVEGNLTGDSEVVIRNTGRVEGNIVAPRVTLEDGSSFRGAIDMQTPQQSQRQKEARSEAAASSGSGAQNQASGSQNQTSGGKPSGKPAEAPA